MSPIDVLHSYMNPERIKPIGNCGYKFLSPEVLIHTYNHSYPIIDIQHDDISLEYSFSMEPDTCTVSWGNNDEFFTFKKNLTEEQFFQFSLIEDFGQLDKELVRACFDFSDYYMENRGEL